MCHVPSVFFGRGLCFPVFKVFVPKPVSEPLPSKTEGDFPSAALGPIILVSAPALASWFAFIILDSRVIKHIHNSKNYLLLNIFYTCLVTNIKTYKFTFYISQFYLTAYQSPHHRLIECLLSCNPSEIFIT